MGGASIGAAGWETEGSKYIVYILYARKRNLSTFGSTVASYLLITAIGSLDVIITIMKTVQQCSVSSLARKIVTPPSKPRDAAPAYY